jgi:hypothetical protein
MRPNTRRSADAALAPAPAAHLAAAADPDAPAVSPVARACGCPGCAMGTICYQRYGVVIGYERAIQASDQRLRVMAQILAHVVGTLAAPRAAIATVHRDGQIGAVLSWRRFPES